MADAFVEKITKLGFRCGCGGQNFESAFDGDPAVKIDFGLRKILPVEFRLAACKKCRAVHFFCA